MAGPLRCDASLCSAPRGALRSAFRSRRPPGPHGPNKHVERHCGIGAPGASPSPGSPHRIVNANIKPARSFPHCTATAVLSVPRRRPAPLRVPGRRQQDPRNRSRGAAAQAATVSSACAGRSRLSVRVDFVCLCGPWTVKEELAEADSLCTLWATQHAAGIHGAALLSAPAGSGPPRGLQLVLSCRATRAGGPNGCRQQRQGRARNRSSTVRKATRPGPARWRARRSGMRGPRGLLPTACCPPMDCARCSARGCAARF